MKRLLAWMILGTMITLFAGFLLFAVVGLALHSPVALVIMIGCMIVIVDMTWAIMEVTD
jgi:hypothetical protein